MSYTPSHIHPTDPTYGWIYRRTIRLKRHQKVRDIGTSRIARIEIKPAFYETTAWYAKRAKFYTFLSPQGRVQCVRKDRIPEENLVGEEIPMMRGRKTHVPEIRNALQKQVLWNQPKWFTDWLTRLLQTPDLYRKMNRCYKVHKESKRRLKYFRRVAWRKYLREQLRCRREGLPLPKKPKCPYPDWKTYRETGAPPPLRTVEEEEDLDLDLEP